MPRSITITDVTDLRGQTIVSQPLTIEPTVDDFAGVVSGEIVPDRFRISGGAVKARVAGSLRTLRDDELHDLLALVEQAEAGFGHPVDVEFCYERRRLWLLQCRAITTL